MQEFRVGFEDHAVLVRLGEDRRDDALAKRIVECVVDGRRRNAETPGGGAVDQHIGRQSIFGVAGSDILDLRDLLQSLQQPRHPDREFVRIGILQRELVLTAADRGVDRQILHRLHVQRNAGDAGDLAVDATDDLAGGGGSLVARLQIDQHPPAVERRVGAVDADEG